MADTLSFGRDLLSLCAMLTWFDGALLLALTNSDGGEVAGLLASDFVQPAVPDHTYELEPGTREAVLARLRAEQPDAELELHSRVVHHYLRRVAEGTDPQRLTGDEETAFRHLRALFTLLIPREGWHSMAEHIAAARQSGFQQPRHLQFLNYYDGYVAVHTGAHERGEAILTTLLASTDLDDSVRVRTMNVLAHLHSYRARYDRALEQYQQVYEVAGTLGDLFHQGAALANMGMVLNDLTQYERALDLILQSLAIFRQIGDQLTEVYILYEIGYCAMQLGRWQVAETHYREAAALAEATGLTGRLASILWGQGLLYHLMGDPAQSEQAYRRGLAIANGPDHTDVMTATDLWWHLGFLLTTQGRWDEALAAHDQARALAEAAARPHTLGLIHFQRGNLFRRQGLVDAAEMAYSEAIQQIEGLRSATEGEEIKIGLLGSTHQLYEAMVGLCIEQGRYVDAFNYVERARSRVFLDTVARRDAALFDALEQPVVTLEEVQARLPAGAVLLEYFVTGVVPLGENVVRQLPAANAHLREHLALPPRIWLFIVTRDHFEMQPIHLDPNALQPPPGSRSPMRRLLHPRHLAYLYEQLIAPAEAALRHSDLLFLVPHGPLHYVPWMALRAADGDYLLDEEGPAIAFAPSATILLRNCLARPHQTDGDFLALGYNDEGDATLRYAEAEARLGAHMMKGDAWTGPDPKGKRLLAHPRTIRWLHIRGHGLYQPHAPLDSALRLGLDDTLSARTIMSDLQLSSTPVTLSACTSGLNQIVPGDELLGLPRAFLYAGAPTVVCSPWEAPDLVALLVMEHFYGAVQGGHAPAAALRDALVAVRTMTGRDLLESWHRWQATFPEETALVALPALVPEQMEQAIFSDPADWALFTLVGRPD